MTSQSIKENLSQDYYNGVGVEDSVAKGIIPQHFHSAARFEYIEVTIDGQNRLCILCPVNVANGPGKKYKATAA